MLLFVFWLSFHFLNEASVTADKICWKTNDLSSKKNVFIRCQKSMIALEDIKINGNSVHYHDMHCSPRVKQLYKCNGLQKICDVTDVDIFDIIEEFVDNCYYRSSSRTVCIVYNCVSGEPNYLMDQTILTKARGQAYKAAQLSGYLHCSIYGDISNITVYKEPLTDITVRDENGSRIIDYDDKLYNNPLYYHELHWSYEYFYKLSSSVFTFTKNGMNLDSIGVTIYSEIVQDVLVLVEGERCGPWASCYIASGGQYYRCEKLKGIEDIQQAEDISCGINDLARFRERFLWITTVLSLLLSLVLVVVYIIQCLLWRKSKRIPLRTKSQTDPSSRRPIANDYETPHVYMDVEL